MLAGRGKQDRDGPSKLSREFAYQGVLQVMVTAGWKAVKQEARQRRSGLPHGVQLHDRIARMKLTRCVPTNFSHSSLRFNRVPLMKRLFPAQSSPCVAPSSAKMRAEVLTISRTGKVLKMGAPKEVT